MSLIPFAPFIIFAFALPRSGMAFDSAGNLFVANPANRTMHLSYSVERSRDAVGNFALPLGASFGIQWRE